MNVNKTHHQNSGLAAQPSKIAYLLKQTLIAAPNVIDPLVAMVVHSLGYAYWNNQRKSCAPILQILRQAAKSPRRAPRFCDGVNRFLRSTSRQGLQFPADRSDNRAAVSARRI